MPQTGVKPQDFATKQDIKQLDDKINKTIIDWGQIVHDLGDRILEQMQLDKAELKAAIKELRVDVAVLKTDVKELKVDVAMLKVDVKELKKDVAVLKVDVAVLKTDVANVKKEIKNIKAEITDVKAELRKQSVGFSRMAYAIDGFLTEHKHPTLSASINKS